KGGIRAHGDGVGVHQAAGRIFIPGQYLLDTLAVLGIHRLQHFADDGIRQVLEDVGDVVRFKVFDDAEQFLGIHAAEEVGLDVFVEKLQYLAFVVGVDQVPQQL